MAQAEAEVIAKNLETAFANKDWKLFYAGVVSLYQCGINDGRGDKALDLPITTPPAPVEPPPPPVVEPTCLRCKDRGECSISLPNPNRPTGPMVTGMAPCPDCKGGTIVPAKPEIVSPVPANSVVAPINSSPRYLLAGDMVIDTGTKAIVYQGPKADIVSITLNK